MSVTDFVCTNCGAALAYDPASGRLRCATCGTANEIAREGEVTEHSFAAFLEGGRGLAKLSEAALEVTCSACGATVEFEPPQVAGECPFCATRIVMQPKAADPLIAPGAVLPFGIDQRRSNELIRAWISGLWFAPSALQALATLDRVKGVYLPHWTFDAQTRTSYFGERGDRYTETEYVRDAQGRTVARQVQKVRWSSKSGAVSNAFDDLTIPATRAVNSERLAALTPWDFERLVPYQPAYLAGFQAQRYQVSLPDAFTLAKQDMEPSIRATIRRDVGGDEQRIHSMNTRYYEVAFKHVLLPVWLGAYRFEGRVFQVCVNARTGEVQGERPYSWIKISLAVLVVILVIVILANVLK